MYIYLAPTVYFTTSTIPLLFGPSGFGKLSFRADFTFDFIALVAALVARACIFDYNNINAIEHEATH